MKVELLTETLTMPKVWFHSINDTLSPNFSDEKDTVRDSEFWNFVWEMLSFSPSEEPIWVFLVLFKVEVVLQRFPPQLISVEADPDAVIIVAPLG